MSYTHKSTFLVVISLLGLFASFLFLYNPKPDLPVIAIANYGQVASLDATIAGIKDGLADKGLVENQDFVYEILDVNFEHTLIRQMLAKLKATHPAVLITLSTPIAQAAKSITDIPIVFSDITAPVEAGLLTHENSAQNNMTGASDRQNLVAFLSFAKKLLPQAKRIGLLYATTDANDQSLVNMMQTAAAQFGMEVVLVPIDSANDVKLRMQAFKNKVDFIYVGSSGPIQPTLPTIVAQSARMRIPVFNADSDAVKKHQVLGSFGVSYYQVGLNTAELVYAILQGKEIKTLTPSYPKMEDHEGYVSKVVADKFGIHLGAIENVTVVE
ncbi:MAG: ABC transporter substrate-binding protein [Proteobacteria bacterium]|nr:ABC transporter substrate-binding protein [Pseudomonadota bacterium]